MDNLYSLYDALVSINVPNERARAVVDALERDMISQLATKTDLQVSRELLFKDLQLQLAELKHTMTLRLGAISVAGIGLLYTLLRVA